MGRRNMILQRLDQEMQVSRPPNVGGSRNKAVSLKGNRVSDEILKLVQRLFAGNGPGQPRIVVFAGAEHGSGCTSICARAGEMLSSGASPVCLIDANPFAPGLFRHFGIRTVHPISAIEPQPEELRHVPANQVPGRKLWLMSCRDGLEDSQSVYNIDGCRARFLDLCSQFDYVLIDAPPVNVSVQTLILGRIADGLVLVLEANYTRRDAALKARESLESAGVRLLGAVLNKRTTPSPNSFTGKSNGNPYPISR